MVRNGGVYFAAVGGAGALIAKCIKTVEVIAFEDLGCESVKRMTVQDLPLTVAIRRPGRQPLRDRPGRLRPVTSFFSRAARKIPAPLFSVPLSTPPGADIVSSISLERKDIHERNHRGAQRREK